MAYLDLTGLEYFKDELVVDTLNQTGKAADAKAAGEAIYDSLPTDTASGSIASFSDGADGVPVEALTVNLEPVQDLHGYDSPWPAGGGKNKLQPTGSTTTINGVTFTVNADGSVTANGTATAQATFSYSNTVFATALTGNYLFNGNPSGASSTTYRMRIRKTEGGTVGSWGYYNGTSDVEVALSSASQVEVQIIVMNGQTVNNIVFKPMLRLATESDASFTPYSNICPITGHTDVEVWRTGVNVWDEEWENGYLGIDGTSISYIASSSRIRSKNWIPVVVGETYYYNGGGYGSFVIGAEDTNGTNAVLITSTDSSGFTFTPTRPFVKFAPRAGYGATYNNDISINYPSTDTTYHAYTADTVEVQIGQTVYGGTLDVVNGVVTVDRAMETVSSGVSSVSTYATGVWAYTMLNVMQIYATTAQSGVSVTNMFHQSNNGDFRTAYRCYTTGRTIVFTTDYEMTVAEANAWLAENPLEVCFTLATPITIDLTAEQLTTLLGQNNVWSDSGDVDITYRADIQLYIQKMIALALNS